MEIISLEEAKKLAGWLEKKSPKTFGGYHKRFFRVIDGEYIIYTEKEKEKADVRGRLNIDSIAKVNKKDDLKFQVHMSNEDKVYHLKAKTKEIRDKWVAAIEVLRTAKEIQQQNERNPSYFIPNKKNNIEEYNSDISTNTSTSINTTTNINPIINEDTTTTTNIAPTASTVVPTAPTIVPTAPTIVPTPPIIAPTVPTTTTTANITSKENKKKNKNLNKNIKLNSKLLDKKGINNLLGLSNPEIKKRFHSGFLKRANKLDIKKKKFWSLVFSSRPLSNIDYEKDDKMIDNSKLKEWLKFDTLFFFNLDKDDENEPIKSLDLKDCHSITCEDKDSKYFIKLEIGDENYFYYNKFPEERDMWFEVLKNSRRTAKEIASSITKKPRNMVRLINIFNKKGKEAYIEEIEKEEKKNLGNYLKIQDYDTLLFVLNEFEKIIKEILDGVLLCYKETGNLMEVTVDYFIDLYLKIVNSFWESNYNRLDNEKIIKLSNILFDFEDLLKKFKIEDDNISKNATELVKIYIKKIYKQLLEFIQNILKSEREVKQIENSKKELITNGPNDLFSTLSNLISPNKTIKVQYIHTYILNMLYEGIIQFLIGTDCITSNYNIKVEPEYLIAICNNTVEFLPLLSNFIDKYKEGCVLSEKRINEEIHMKSILSSLNLLRKNVVLRYVIQLSKPLADSFNSFYHLIDLNKIIDITSDVYFKYNVYINSLVKKRIWEEILKLTVYYYMKLLITTASRGMKSAGDLIKKLMEDKNLLKDQYGIIVGENLTLVNLKIFDDIITFLQIDSSLIASACLPLRKFCGSIFDLQIVGNLLQFRHDLSEDELKEVISACRDCLTNYREDDNSTDKNSFFQTMEKKSERRTSVVERMEKKKKKTKANNSLDNFFNDDDIEELESNVFNLETFMDDENDEKESEDESNIDNKDENNNIIKVENEKVTDVIMEGKLKKKKRGYKKYTERYFQIKSGYIYWFSDHKSKHVQNKINIKNIVKVETHGPCKIRILVEDPNDKESGGNIYKFKAEDGNSKLAWVKVITEEMNKLKGEDKNKNTTVYKTPYKKKYIKDILQLPDIGTERTNIKLQIIEQIKSEGFFPFNDDEEKKNKNNEEKKEEKEEKKIEKYDPHSTLFDEGELKQYDVGLEEAKEKKEEGFFGTCCESLLNLFTGGKKKDKDVKP